MTTTGHLAHWSPSDSVHLVCVFVCFCLCFCVCDRYRSEYKGSVDHLVCFQATSLPLMSYHRTTHAMFCSRFCPSVPVQKDKNKRIKKGQRGHNTLKQREHNVKSLVDPYTRTALCCDLNIELSVHSRSSKQVHDQASM